MQLRLTLIRYWMIRVPAITATLVALVFSVFVHGAGEAHTHQEPGQGYPIAGLIQQMPAAATAAYRQTWVPYRGGAILPENLLPRDDAPE